MGMSHLKILTDKNFFHEDMNSRKFLLSIGTASFCFQNLLSKNINVRIYRTIILPVV